MEKDMEKYIKDLESQLNYMRLQYKDGQEELTKMVRDIQARQSYDYGVEKYYILTEKSQDLINDAICEFCRNIEDYDKFSNYKFYIDDWKLQGDYYYIKAEEGHLKIYLDKHNNSVLLHDEPIKRGFVFKFNYSNKSLYISKIR